jgi:site-specific recombinase XerD
MTAGPSNCNDARPGSDSVVIGYDRPDARAANVSLADWSSMAHGAFAANTVRAWKADWAIFSTFCRRYRLEPLPASPKTVRDFVLECVANQKKPATIRRYVSTIGRAHRAANVLDPTATEAVKLALKEMGRGLSARQRQARGLVWAEIAEFLSFEPRGMRDVRDRALVAAAYDTMCRRDELVNLRIEDMADSADGSGSVLIRRSRTAASHGRRSVEGLETIVGIEAVKVF